MLLRKEILQELNVVEIRLPPIEAVHVKQMILVLLEQQLVQEVVLLPEVQVVHILHHEVVVARLVEVHDRLIRRQEVQTLVLRGREGK